MTRLIDRLLSRDAGFWEGMASGAAIFTTTYGSPDREALLPGLASTAHQLYGTNGVVFSAIMARMALLSEARFSFQRLADKDLFTDRRLAVLQRPWADGNEGELIVRAEQDVSLAGNFYLWNAGERLVRWRPEWTTIVSRIVDTPGGGHYRQVIGYDYAPPRELEPQYGEPQFATAAEVVHWAPMPDPAAEFRGMSWLTPVIRDAQADSMMTGYKTRYLQNNASPGLLIKYAQRLAPATIDQIRERAHARYGGPDNAGGTLVLDSGADATIIGSNLAQMDFSNVQQAGADRVLAAANVPGLLVGLEPIKGAGKSYEQVIRRFADFYGRPQWRSLCGALQKFIPGNDIDGGAVRLWFDTADISALQEGEQERAQIGLVHAQGLLTLRQAGYTRDSAVKALAANDISLLELDPAAAMPPGQAVQHLLPQAPGSGPGVVPLPPGNTPRLPLPTVSAGDGGNLSRPTRRPASVRRDDAATLNGSS